MSSTPPPLSSASSETNSPSPTTPLTELKADPSDTLQFLLQTMAQAHSHANANTSLTSLPTDTQPSADSSFDSSAEPDWASHLRLGAAPSARPQVRPRLRLQLLIPMDLGFDQNMAVDPSALHFTTIFDQSAFSMPSNEGSFLLSNELVPNNHSQMLFPNPPAERSPWPPAHSDSRSGRRLSITSSSSSSGGLPLPRHGTRIGQLAQRVRQMAGVMLAVPVSAQVQQLAAAGGQSKLPIPRLKQPSAPASTSKRSQKASPPPAADAETPVASSSTSSPSAVPSGRECPVTTVRYTVRGPHTNIPALRVLEVKAGEPSPYNDVVDARGFVDGVKVARKMSKANILGKATEYIRVLKKREARLKREKDGLKSLISGLVGGPALLKEWEREWREQFGGEEKDEIEDDDNGASDDDEGEGDDSDGEDEEGRARKKAKVAKPPKKEKPYPRPPTEKPLANPTASIAPSPVAPSTPATMSSVFSAEQPMQDAFGQAPMQTQQAPAQQYLLAVFAFFSVFNSPLTASRRSHTSHSHAHHGTVLTPHAPTETQVPIPTASGYGMHDVVQAAHLLVSTLVFFYVLVPWFSTALRQSGVLARLSSAFARSGKPGFTATSTLDSKHKARTRAALTEALSPAIRGSHLEPAHLRAALGVTMGALGLLQSVLKAARRDRGIELNQLEQRAWVRLGELIAFDGSVGATTRLQTFWCMSWHISTFAASTTDLSTLALIIRPVSSSKASELWERARKREFLRAHEKIVLNNMSVEDAADWLAKWRTWHDTERKGRCTACEKRTPLGVLAAILIRERLRKHAASLFVRTVVRAEDASRKASSAYDSEDECTEPISLFDAEKEFQDEQERKETLAQAIQCSAVHAQILMLPPPPPPRTTFAQRRLNVTSPSSRIRSRDLIEMETFNSFAPSLQEPHCVLALRLPELLLHIAQFTDPPSLAAFVLACRLINQALTPSHYADIVLDGRFQPALACLRALERPAHSNAYARDLAAFVRRLRCDHADGASYPTFVQTDQEIAEGLLVVLPRMTRLQRFVWTSYAPHTSQFAFLFAFLLNGSHSAPLRSIDVIWPTYSDNLALSWQPRFVPTLTTLRLSFIHPENSERAAGNRATAVGRTAFPTNTAFPTLEELELAEDLVADVLGLPDYAPLRQAPRLETLRISIHSGRLGYPGGLPIHVEDFARVERLCCPYHVLPIFLPAALKPRGAISSVDVCFTLNLGRRSSGLCATCDIRWCPCVHCSSTPSKEVGRVIDAGRLQALKALSIRSALLSLDERACEEYLSALGPALFSQLPRLSTFSLQTLKCPRTRLGQNVAMYRSVLGTYEAYPSLKRITTSMQVSRSGDWAQTWTKVQSSWERQLGA
ncbi:hypothetical protein BN946_scf184845.g72 [Trametes cinnabarina]|uniref:BHLH domain-containing protein n=1 Tax=Pycnoporus cinnabarinus TaxID=5643 RepID=A0A060SAC9_PYCCI|nr:hypothetical protein BN946_scf184845.g72 [Trametes cinnabarina]